MARHRDGASYLREFIFGVEDGLITSFGIVTGVTAAAAGIYVILLAGVVEMFAGAVSMAAGTYLSIKAQREVMVRERRIATHRARRSSHVRHDYNLLARKIEQPFHGALVMAASFVIGAAIPLLPYLIGIASWEASLGLTVVALFGFGATKGRYTQRDWLRSGLEMLAVGMIAGLAGYAIGSLFVAG